MKRRLLFLCAFLWLYNLYGQKRNPDSLFLRAQLGLFPLSKHYNPPKAFASIKELAEGGHARSMNELGKLYEQGKGCEKDASAALGWYEKAAKAGYPDAWGNSGLMYKNGKGTKQDFKKAYEQFSTGATAGSTYCRYALGFMHYKGLACQQDYVKAKKLFLEASEKGSKEAMYMLGLCFRNGYGLNVNLDSARYYLQKSAARGFMPAKEELANPKAENLQLNGPPLEPEHLNTVEGTGQKIDIKGFSKIKKADLEGAYSGFIIKYDWSGKYIIGKSRLDLRLSSNGKKLEGEWLEDDSLAALISAKVADSGLVFSNTGYSRKERYLNNKNDDLRFETAQLRFVKNGDSVFIAGRLQLYSEKIYDMERPMYLSITKKVTDPAREKALAKLESIPEVLKAPEARQGFIAYPNPVTNSFNIDFRLDQASLVTLQLFNVNGFNILSNQWKLPAGQHTKQIDASALTAGTYILRLKSNGTVKTTTILKY